jgi:hypothetical protein
MSALGQTRRFRDVRGMSGLSPTADISGPGRHFAFGPNADIRQAVRLAWEQCKRIRAQNGRDGATHSSGHPARRHDLDSWRHFPHGVGSPLPGGSAGPSRRRRRPLDRPDAGHQRAVPQVRRGDGLRHLGRDRARSQGLSRRPAAYAEGGRSCLHPAKETRRPQRLEPVVEFHLWRQLAPALRQGQPHRRPRRPSGGAGRL